MARQISNFSGFWLVVPDFAYATLLVEFCTFSGYKLKIKLILRLLQEDIKIDLNTHNSKVFSSGWKDKDSEI